MEEIKAAIYPVEDWNITETKFDLGTNYRNETTFSLSNGYLGTRGTFEEGYPFSVDEGLEGNFINGFYESEDIRYGEWNFGFPQKSQSLLNVPNAKTVRIYLEEELFDMQVGEITDYRRILHMKQGILTRNLVWTSPNGKKVKLLFERFASLADKNVMCQRLKLIPLNFNGKITLESRLEADVENHTRKTNPLVDYGPFGKRIQSGCVEVTDNSAYFEGTTIKSNLTMACGSVHSLKISSESEIRTACHKKEYLITNQYSVNLCEGEEMTLDKLIVYSSSLDLQKENLKGFVQQKMLKMNPHTYDMYRKKQVFAIEDYWKYADVVIEGDMALQQGIRFNLFHIMQAAGRDGKTGMGAKGLSGEGYEGHYFWDTEMYVLPVFIYTAPEIAKKLLDYRFHTLEQARKRARELGHEKGALYPWRTINGEEASTYFPLGTAQYHINADVAYAFWLYVSVTGDLEYLREKAAEVLCETARVWADVGCFAECKGNRYCICSVTGPDEYNAIVDNNFYTNLMARENIKNALEALDRLQKMDETVYREFVEKMRITEEETAFWERIVANMYFPYDEARQIYPLDDGFMMRKPWDDSKIPPEKRHLLYENFHPLFVYRQRMSKQADAILGMYLHSNLFTEDELKRNYDFYQEVTLHHSSLSTCIFGILACEIGYEEEAYSYFAQSARMDLDDYHENFYAGIHAANMAGTFQAIVNGFAGLRTNSGTLMFQPFVPPKWKGYQFTIRYQGSVLSVVLHHRKYEFTLVEGSSITFILKDKSKKEEKTIHLTREGESYVETI